MNEIAMHLTAFDKSRNPDGAAAFVTELVNTIGIGFHPDTPFSDYVAAHGPAERVFDDQTAVALQSRLDSAVAILDAAGKDVYEIGWEAQDALCRRLGLR